jgi:hypothetical protein
MLRVLRMNTSGQLQRNMSNVALQNLLTALVQRDVLSVKQLMVYIDVLFIIFVFIDNLDGG